MLTRQLLYHLTIRAKLGGDGWIRANDLLRMKQLHYRCATSPKFWWRILESNQVCPKATDLQSAEVTSASHSPKIGSTGWVRTTDQMINSHLLYRLSYCGILLSLRQMPKKLKIVFYILQVKQIILTKRTRVSTRYNTVI